MRIYVINILFIGLVLNIFSQEDSIQLVKYTPEFEFNEGIYLTFDQVKKNQPIPKSRIISSLDPNNRDFFNKLFLKEKIYIYDNFGMKKLINKESIWGYCSNGFIYLRLSEGFHRISIVGRLCHFVADVTVYSTHYNDPYYYNTYNSYSNRSVTTKSSELRQYLLDFSNGKVYDYDVSSLEIVLMSDPELSDEYMALKKKKKKQLKFYYLRKFNEQNPLYFPVSN